MGQYYSAPAVDTVNDVDVANRGSGALVLIGPTGGKSHRSRYLAPGLCIDLETYLLWHRGGADTSCWRNERGQRIPEPAELVVAQGGGGGGGAVRHTLNWEYTISLQRMFFDVVAPVALGAVAVGQVGLVNLVNAESAALIGFFADGVQRTAELRRLPTVDERMNRLVALATAEALPVASTGAAAKLQSGAVAVHISDDVIEERIASRLDWSDGGFDFDHGGYSWTLSCHHLIGGLRQRHALPSLTEAALDEGLTGPAFKGSPTTVQGFRDLGYRTFAWPVDMHRLALESAGRDATDTPSHAASGASLVLVEYLPHTYGVFLLGNMVNLDDGGDDETSDDGDDEEVEEDVASSSDDGDAAAAAVPVMATAGVPAVQFLTVLYHTDDFCSERSRSRSAIMTDAAMATASREAIHALNAAAPRRLDAPEGSMMVELVPHPWSKWRGTPWPLQSVIIACRGGNDGQDVVGLGFVQPWEAPKAGARPALMGDVAAHATVLGVGDKPSEPRDAGSPVPLDFTRDGHIDFVPRPLAASLAQTASAEAAGATRVVLVYYGSFAPFHAGHAETLALARRAAEGIWGRGSVAGAIVTPLGELYHKAGHLAALEPWRLRAQVAQLVLQGLGDWAHVDDGAGQPGMCVYGASRRFGIDGSDNDRLKIVWVNGADIRLTPHMVKLSRDAPHRCLHHLFMPRAGPVNQPVIPDEVKADAELAAVAASNVHMAPASTCTPKLSLSSTDIRMDIAARRFTKAARAIGNAAAAACLFHAIETEKASPRTDPR